MKSWLTSLSEQQPLAVITASSVNTLSFARSLGRRGIPVLILDSDRQLAIFTRFARVIYLEPSDRNPRAWIDQLVSIGRCLKTPGVLIPTADPHCVLIAENQDLLRPYFNFLVPKANEVRNFVSKRYQIEIARGMGLAVPDSWFPNSLEEIERLSDRVQYPCIVKPDRSHTGARLLAGKKLIVVDSKLDLIEAFVSLSGDDVSCIVQEIIPGADSELVSYLGFWNAESAEVAFITKRKLRQFPKLYGNGSIQVSEELPEVAELSRQLLKALEYRGFASVEFKFDNRDGTYRFVEINPRTSAMNELAVVAGVDFPWIAYEILSGATPLAEKGPAFRAGIRCVNEDWDLQAFWAMRKAGDITVREWLRSLQHARRIISAWDDPKPLLMEMVRASSLPFHRWNHR